MTSDGGVSMVTWVRARFKRLAGAALVLGLLAPGAAAAAPAPETGVVNIYSYREEILIRPILDAFTAETGIKVNLVSGGAEALLERLKAEGKNSPADVLLTADVARLVLAKDGGLLQPVRSDVLTADIPAAYRDHDNQWFGISVRARVPFYARARVQADAITSYEDLADPRWKGRLCVRSSSSVYNQSLLADLIARHGPEKAEAWARGIVANLARKPQGADRDQLKAVAAGECDVALANTYYYFGMLSAPAGSADRTAAEAVALAWPNQQEGGAHVNVSGGGVTASAKHRAEAVRLLEFMVGERAQQIYAAQIYEYPIRAGVAPAALVAAQGSFKADTLPLADYAKFGRQAMMIFDRVGWR